LSDFPWSLRFFLWRYAKDIVYRNPVTSLDDLKLRIVAAIAAPQMMENTWKEIEYRLDILSGMKGAHAKIVLHSSGLILEK
jgi:hypothetical protein